jgi:hypothetical protein
MEVRCLVSAHNAGQTFDLRCEVREKMLAFLAAEHPDALPRQRLVTTRATGPDHDEALNPGASYSGQRPVAAF